MQYRYIAIVLMAAFPLISYTSVSNAIPTPATQPTTVPDLLQVPVGHVKASGTDLSDIIDQLREASGRNILVNWKALKSVEVTKDLPVTVDLSDLSLGHSLDKLLSQVGGFHTRLAYEIDDDVIVISTTEDFAKFVTTVVYDTRAHERDLEAIKRRVSGIDPLSWKAAGGSGQIDEFKGQLVITQTEENHAKIAAELHDELPAPEKSPQTPH